MVKRITLQALTILLIATTSSGCGLLRNNVMEPLCLPDRPSLENISIVEQSDINAQTLRKIADNDRKLKAHVRVTERLVEEHNKQFKAECL